MRTYLVVIDDSPEASLALRFAARRAARTGGGVAVLAIIPPQDFVAFGGVQATSNTPAPIIVATVTHRIIVFTLCSRFSFPHSSANVALRFLTMRHAKEPPCPTLI